MTESEIQELAQQLVDLKIEMKQIAEEQNIAKLELYDYAKGGIACNGGMVYFVEEGESKRFDKTKLKELLIVEGLSENQINIIFENSMTTATRDANINVKLS